MSAPKNGDFHANVRSWTAVRSTSMSGTSQDRSSARYARPTLPPLTPLSPPPDRPLSRPDGLSVLELPQLVAKVGPQVATAESLWMDGPCLMASALGVDIPPKVIKHSQEAKSISAEENSSLEKNAEAEETKTEMESKTKRGPQTGFEVFELFTKKRHLGELRFFHLKVSEDVQYRPYDLQVVPRNKAGSDHYIFSSTSVMHVQDGCSVELLTLAEWYHEAVLWKALRKITFFRDYFLHKAFRRWRRNVCRIVFQCKRKLLQSQLLIAVPQFREALFHFTRLLEELKKVHWLPQDETRTYTLLEFQTTLSKRNEESRRVLERFLHFRSVILAMVRKTSYKARQELKHQVEQFQLNQCSQAMHLQQASNASLNKELKQAEQALQKLGNFAALMDSMIVQSLVTTTRHEIMAFHDNILKRKQEQQDSLFQAELTFGADGQLAIFPPMHRFQEVLLGALLSVRDSVVQVFDSCSNSDSEDSLMAIISPVDGLQDCCTGFACTMNGSVRRASKDRGAAQAKSDSFAFVKETTKFLVPKPPSLKVQGQRIQGHYNPLSRKQLEFYLDLHAGTQEVEKEQAKVAEEAHQEIQQLCERHSWLVDTHLFTSQWSTTSLESMRGCSAHKYKEHIQKVHFWRDHICVMPPAFTTSNKLLTVACSHVQERLGPLLATIEEDSFKLISDELHLHSENLTFELKKVMESLKPEPTDFSEFVNYALMVKSYKEMSFDIQQHLDYLCSLQKIIQLNWSNMTPGDVALTQQALDLWNQFVPLLKKATDTVTQKLPSMTNTLDSTFSSLSKKLEDLNCTVSTGPYLDPKQSAGHMIAELKKMHRNFDIIVADLHELSRTSQSLRGHPLDLTFVMTAQENIEARKELWELMGVSTARIQEWKLLLFSKFVVSSAQEKVTEWLQQADTLARIIPPNDAVLQETLHNLESFHQQLSVLAKISSPTLKHKHWRNIFKGIGLLYAPEQNFTLADLMSKELLEHQNQISKICSDARAAADVEHTFQKLQQSWDGTVFRLAKFIVTLWQTAPNSPQPQSIDSGTFTIIGLEELLSKTEDSVMTLSIMVASPHAVEFRREAEHLVQLLHELEELLNLCEKYQEKWTFLSEIFYETSFSIQKAELLKKFGPVDKAFREMIQLTLSDPHVLNFVRLRETADQSNQFQGQNLHILFTEGVTIMEEIISQLLYLLGSIRDEFPRLYFLSDREVIKLLSPHLTAPSLLSLVRKCFRGVRWLEVNDNGEHDMMDLSSDRTQMWVKGVYGTLKERVPLLCTLEPNLNTLIWLGLFEKRLYQAVKQLIFKCIAAQHAPAQHKLNKDSEGNPSPDHVCISSSLRKDVEKPANVTEPPAFMQLIVEYPLQCLLVAEDVLWCSELEKAFHSPAQTRRVQVESKIAAKLKCLCQAIQATDPNDNALASKHTVTALRAMILLTMKHSQQVTGLTKVKSSIESSFEWQRLLKYRCSALGSCNQSFVSHEDPDCTAHCVSVDVMGKQLAYGYDYIGPENWMMVNTPLTDRAFLGILLAITSYRCAYISGPPMSGKEHTILQLGLALGQQVITLGCCASTSPLIVQQMLLGALQAGAWIVLDSVDSMAQGTLSILGQNLTNIHQCLSTHQRNSVEEVQELTEHNDFTKKHSPKHPEMECKIQFGGKKISAKLSFGCAIISSNGYSTEIPENLRVASRPVSLMQPDYSIIAEVLLTALGFTEAASMSRRLVSLFNLAKDSFCLPEFVSHDKSSWLVLLTKVIYASGTHLYNSFGKTNKNTVLKWDGQRPVDLTLKGSDKTEDHHSSLPESARSSIVNAVKEERAVIKGVMLVLLPTISEHKRALQFRTIFEEVFPNARSFSVYQDFIEESEQNLLRNAVIEELQQTGLCADTQVLRNAVTFHQTLGFSKAVVLVGPAGSGKTTLYQTLAGAYQQLAAKSVETESEEENSRCLPTSCWFFVSTKVFFPNAFSHEELFGRCCERTGSWWDGVLTKVIRQTEWQDFPVNDLSKGCKKKDTTQKVKWLVLDGEPLNQPGWFDSLSTLGNRRVPFLYLSSGENIQPSQEKLKIIIETTSLRDAAPSALAQCSLVYVSGKDMWKNAWKVEIDALYRDHALDESTLTMWSSLAEDLFSSTLISLKENALTTVMSNNGCPGIAEGLQEVTSFIKILHALLGESSKACGLKSASKQTEERDTELEARNLFVVAYIWGFGGQLHPRHWPQFDLLARDALFKSRYKIEVPMEGTVFEHFFNFSDGKHLDTTNANSFTRKSPLYFYTPVPQYQKHAYLMELMLKSCQPALLVGELGAGKTMLCNSLLQERPHLHFPVTPLLDSAHLRNVLKIMSSRKTHLDSLGTIKLHPGLLLFVDDLHDAPFENNGKTSMPLENLRQCISQGGLLTPDDHFMLLSSGAINYLGTCSTFGTNSCNHISPRLSRLFTILVLPSMTVEILFSIYSMQLQPWLKKFPSMPRIADMARCIVTATYDVYLSMPERLQFSEHTPHTVFSLHDLKKVFIGMCLWNPRTADCGLLQRKLNLCFQTHSSSASAVFPPAPFGPLANVLNIAHLWMHECLRTFGDCLSSDEEIQNLVSALTQVSEEIYGSKVLAESQTSHSDTPGPACHLEINSDNLNQHQNWLSVQQDNDKKITSKKEFEKIFMAELTEDQLRQSEKSEWSEEQSSSESSFSRSDIDEDDFSIDSSSNGSKNERGYPKTDEFRSESAPSTSNYTLQIPFQSPLETNPFESSVKKMSQKLAEVNQCKISVCETHQASYQNFLQLLLEMGPCSRSTVYSPELSEALRSTAHQQFKHNSVYQERDLDMLLQQLTHMINRKEEEDGCKYADFAAYRMRVCQLVHILRALLIPGGHGVLFGATKKTGRKTTVRFAAYLMGYQLIEVHLGNEDKLQDVLREARRQIDAHGGHVVFLIHEDISQNTRNKLLTLMTNGTVPGLYSDEDLVDMLPNINATMNNLRIRKRYCKYNYRNLHIFLLLPLSQGTNERQTGLSSVTVLHIIKAFSSCFCVEVYQPWSSEALVEVALDHIKRSLQDPVEDVQIDLTLVACIAQVMAEIHQSANKYASSFLNIQPFSPETFFELMGCFYQLCGHLIEQGRGPANRVVTALVRVKDMTDAAQKISQEVFNLKVKFDMTQKWLNQLQRAVDNERTHCEQARQHCRLEESRLSLLEEQSELAEHEAEDAMKEVSPLYQAALKALQSLNQSDLDEVRHYRHPPDGVVMLMNAICMLFNRPCNWESSKQLLGQPDFLQELVFFDRSKLSNELFQKLSQIVDAPSLQPHLVRSVSCACESLSSWIKALYKYACAQRCLAPQEARKNHLNKLMTESRTRLRVARLQEEAARDKLDDMERQQQLVTTDLEELAAQLHKAEIQEKEASAAIKQISHYTEKWKLAEKEAEMNKKTISGDALILAATIAYLGPFGPDSRLDLLEEWHKDFPFEPIPVSMELHKALARAVGLDNHLIQEVSPHLVLKLLLWGHSVPWAHHWALLADTEQNEELSFQTIQLADNVPGERGSQIENEHELVVSADDPEFLSKLRHGAEKGLRVLITHIEHALPSAEFLSMLDQPAGKHGVGIFQPVKTLHSDFCLFLSTSLPVQLLIDEVHPLILEKIKIIDMSLSKSEVQDVILSNVMQSKGLEVWAQHCQLKTEKKILQDKLHLEEASLMEYVLQSFTPLLEDPEFPPLVSLCQSTSLRLQAEIEELSSEIESHKPLLKDFQDIGVLATALYKALQDVGRLSPFYFFPLHNFLVALQEALALKDKRIGERVNSGVFSEISHRMVSYIIDRYRPCLIQSHAEVLRLLVSVAFFMNSEGYIEIEHIAFLKGISEIESQEYAPTSEQSASELPSWIPLHLQADVHLLEKIPSFQGLVSSLRNSSRQWKEYFRFPSSTVIGLVPCPSHSHLTTLQRALIWKTLFPQWLAAVADDLAACQQGEPVSSPAAGGSFTGSPEALSYFLSRNKGPVIVTLPGLSNDESVSIHPLYWIIKVAQCQADNKGVTVNVISFGSEGQRDSALSMLNDAVQTGQWLVLNNCHLLDHWDVAMVSQLKQLILHKQKDKGVSKRCSGSYVHPHFRLWFITKGNAPQSIPAFVRIRALHLVVGSYWDFRDDLRSSLRQVISTVPNDISTRHTINLVEPLIRCAVLHSVLLQRQKFKHLGQGRINNWTPEDLLALVDAQVSIAKHCSDPTGALEYIAADLVYGGHVSDSTDLKAVEAVCRACLRPAPSMWGSGPHTLLEMMMGRYSEDQDLLKSLECRVQTTKSNDCVLLGFSAGLMSEIVKVKSRSLNIMLLKSQGRFTPARDTGIFNQFQELSDYKNVQGRLQVLQDTLSRGMGLGTESVGPLRTFIQTEWENLVEVVSSLLKGIAQPSQNLSVSSYTTLCNISKLEIRARLLRMYLTDGSKGSDHVYCLSAFANPRGFLAAMIRETLLIKQQDVTHGLLHFQVLGASTISATVPSSGICLSGLELHGALWDTRLGVLQETLSSQPCSLPLLWVRAENRDTDSLLSNPSCSMPAYNCPLYVDHESTNDKWTLTEENIVTHVPLMARLDPVLCTMRRVRLVSRLVSKH